MKKYGIGKRFAAFGMILALLAMPLLVISQTDIKVPKNKYKIEDDQKLGADYSKQVEQELPILNDTESTRYLAMVGDRLEGAIPAKYRQQRFNCGFKIVNARDINAFALPACYLYVNRGMIEAAKNEGEMAGVMAHEISHAMLRHSTAQMTQQSNPLNQILGIGAILGGAIVLGETGAAIGQTIYSGLFVLPYSREYETQADTLGAQILANAGYDPRDLANMFKTIEKQSGGGGGPDWFSTHPNPQSRYDNINREADMLNVSNNPYKLTRGFERIQAKFRTMPKAKSMKEIEEEYKRNKQQNQGTMNQGRYSSRVALPSTRTRAYSSGNWIQMNVPDNWKEFPGENNVDFAPEGAYGDQGITRGALLGIENTQSRDLGEATEAYVDGVLQNNNYLGRQGSYTRTTISGRTAYSIVLSGRSPVTNQTEVATVYTTLLRNGQLFAIVTVVPQNEQSSYNATFRNMIRSIRLSD
ncbi:MAG: M48 family metalloprotease [Acidobacteria bacterium]|nr:M48 family metalloprotease [Acidobacteriota bacterium]